MGTEDPSPLVSISVTAYQHAPFLAACLDGILMQECDFAYEILLGEDDSSDGTREIAQRYADRHPDRIRLFLHSRSQVIHIDGRPTGRFNLLNNVRNARGRYLCHIDGDDRWTDQQRLRIMVEEMESKPHLGLSFHNAMNVWPDGTQAPYLDPARARPLYTRSDHTVKNFIPTSGVIWRLEQPQVIPQAWMRAPFGDWALNIHFARNGPISYVDRFMSVRNVHATGTMHVLGELGANRAIAVAYEVMRTQAGDELAPAALDRWTRSLTDGFDMAIRSGQRDQAKWFLRHASAVPDGRVPIRQRVRWWSLIHFPRVMEAYHRLRTGRR